MNPINILKKPALRKWLGMLAYLIPPERTASIPVAAAIIKKQWNPWIIRNTVKLIEEATVEGDDFFYILKQKARVIVLYIHLVYISPMKPMGMLFHLVSMKIIQ